MVTSSKAKKQLIEKGEKIPQSLLTYQSLLPSPTPELAGDELMYEAVTDDAVFLNLPGLTVLQRTSALNYIMYGAEIDPKCKKHTWAISGQVQRDSQLHLRPGRWLNDKLIDYSL